ncbi:MAG: conditioned medium factor, partial [Planctomycetota bacterium]
THLTTYDLLVGRPVGLLASMQTGDPGIKRASIERAHVELTTPTGDVVRTPMRWTDKGWRHEFEPTEPGRHTARVTVLGRRDDGASLVRTTQHVLQILPDQLALGNEARIEPDTPGVWRVSIPLARADRDAPVIVSAEIWATPRDGDARCVCWLSRMASPSEPDATLFLDERWLARAGEFDQLELRNVRVQCCDSAIPLDRAPRMQIAGDDRIAIARRAPESITRDMLIGRPRAELVLPNRASDASRQARAFAGHNLMLVHGYCSSLVWPSGDFSGSVEVFADPSQNRSHDEFANLLLAFGNNSKSFGIVAHSQGGAAALHLWTYYFSGLDWAEGPRLIQSVGTPYQGTPLAGNLAILGDIFGTGCGANFDLSTDGAAMWLAGIPTASRAAVSYWTTSADGAACNFFSGLFLSDPEDGVVEVSRGQLAGANNMGNLEGWCHSTSMSDPPHYTDPSRNAEMNAEAAR